MCGIIGRPHKAPASRSGGAFFRRLENPLGAPYSARVEHVFGAQSNDMGGTLVRSIGLVRARARIGLKSLACNMRRLVHLERLAAAAPT